MNDFMTIEKERYFESIQHNIKGITAKSNEDECRDLSGAFDQNFTNDF